MYASRGPLDGARYAASTCYGRSMSPDARRLIAKLVLFLAGVWVLFLAAGIATALRGPFDPIRFPLFLIPGSAFVPAAYYALVLHRGDDSDRSWKFLAIYAIAGVVLMVGSGNALHQLPPPSDL
jgi:hypothetical protein